MAYARTRTYKKKAVKRYPKRNYKSKSSLAVKAYKMAKTCLRQRERKFATYNRTSTVSNKNWDGTSSFIYRLFDIAQGDGSSNRNGDVIFLQDLFIKMRVRPSGDLTSGVNFRLIVVQDKQTIADATNPQWNDIFMTNDMNSPYNYPKVVQRFKMLYDKTFPVKYLFSGGYYNGALGTQWYDHTINNNKYINIKLKNFYKTIRYNGSTAADLQKNGIYIGICIDEDQPIDYEWYVMSKYTDS